MKYCISFIATIIAALMVTAFVIAQGGYQPIPQSPALWGNEAYLVYLGNLARVENGVPPLRFNIQLNNAARWFAWDSVVNRPVGFCDHQDSLGNYPGDRALAFSYLGSSGSEIAFCGYVSPEDAVAGWLDSYYHREILLDPNSREAGPGYYSRDRDGRGYVVLDFGSDPVYAPVVIDNEAPSTTSRQVNLHIYNREQNGGMNAQGPATEMQVSNDACFSGAQWQPYTSNLAWNLADGPAGWRAVYVRTRDALGRLLSASDWIYLGSDYLPDLLTENQLSTTSAVAPLVGLDSDGLPLMQFSQSWLVDDSIDNLQMLAGSGERVGDSSAWGGSAFRLDSAGSSAWMWSTNFPAGKPMTAYVRLKVSDNRSTSEVASFSIADGATLHLNGTDFKSAGAYQEFALPFTLPQDGKFLMLQVSRSGDASVFFDAATFFTAPVPFQAEYSYPVEGGNFRGQGIWVRYTDGAGQFTSYQVANTVKPGLAVTPAAVQLYASRDHSKPVEAVLRVTHTCLPVWQVDSNVSWLDTSIDGDEVILTVHPEQLRDGDWSAQVRVTSGDTEQIIVPVSLRVSNYPYALFLPVLR